MTTKDDFNTFLAQVRKTTGIDALTPDDSGLTSVRVDDAYNLNLQYIESTGKILCFIEVAELPKDSPKEIYRDLLIGGLFGRDTAGGYFALEDESETVVYNYYFDLYAVVSDVEAFVSTIEKILQLCDIWAERIKRTAADATSGNGQNLHNDPNLLRDMHAPSAMHAGVIMA